MKWILIAGTVLIALLGYIFRALYKAGSVNQRMKHEVKILRRMGKINQRSRKRHKEIDDMVRHDRAAGANVLRDYLITSRKNSPPK